VSDNNLNPPDASGKLPPEVIAKHEAAKARRRQLKKQHAELFQQLRDCLFRHDPMRLNFGSNDDEYEPEVGTILPRLHTCTSEKDVLKVVYEEFKVWFAGGWGAGRKASYRAVSAEIWRLWNQAKK